MKKKTDFKSSISKNDSDIELSDARGTNSQNSITTGISDSGDESNGNNIVLVDQSEDDDDEDGEEMLHRLSDNYRRYSETYKSRNTSTNSDEYAQPDEDSNTVEEEDPYLDQDDIYHHDPDSYENDDDENESGADNNQLNHIDFEEYDEYHFNEDNYDSENSIDQEDDIGDNHVNTDYRNEDANNRVNPGFLSGNTNSNRASALEFLTSALSNGIDPEDDTFRDFLLNGMSSRIATRNSQNSEHAPSGVRNPNRTQRMMMNSFLEHLIPGGSNQSSQFSSLMKKLETQKESYLIMETLNEISSSLLMMSSLQSERQVPTFTLAQKMVSIINEYPEDLELQLVACRCIYNLAEVNFDSMDSIVSAGVVECLNSKLLDLNYIDMAEQVLQSLEIISRKKGRKILMKGSIPIIFTYLDFLTTHAQRKALKIAANASISMPNSKSSDIATVFPTIKNVATNYTDSQCVESSWIFIANTIFSFSKNPSLLLTLLDDEFVKKICDLFPVYLQTSSKSSNVVTFKTCIKLLSALTYFCKICPKFSNNLLFNCGLTKMITRIFASFETEDLHKNIDNNNMSIEAILKCPKELIITLLNFIIAVLPLNDEKIKINQSSDIDGYIHLNKHQKQPNFEKLILLEDRNTENIFKELFPLLLHIYDATVEYKIRRLVFISILRMLYLMPSQELEIIVYPSNITLMLASSLTHAKSLLKNTSKQPKDTEMQKFYSLLFGSLLIAECLISSEVFVFLDAFKKEGITSQITELREWISQEFGKASAIDNNPIQLLVDDEKSEDSGVDYSDEEEEEMLDNDDIEYAFEHKLMNYNKSNSSHFKSLSKKSMLNSLSLISIAICNDYEKLVLSNNIISSRRVHILENIIENADTLLEKEGSYEEWKNIWTKFADVLNVDSSYGPPISSFELISTGIVTKLLNAFSSQKNYTSNLIIAFSDIFCSRFSPSFSENFSPLISLVQKLEESLDRNESFQIIGADFENSSNSSQRAHSMTKQMKIKLIPKNDSTFEPNDTNDKNRGILLIVHAIATFESIQTFIKSSKNINIKNNFNLNTSSLDSDYHYEFYINDQLIPSDATIFGAIYKSYEDNKDQIKDIKENIGKKIHKIQYKAVYGKLNTEDRIITDETVDDALLSLGDIDVINILKLLKILYNINMIVENPAANENLFLNYKLTAKINRQLDEPIFVASGILPDWSMIIPREFPFLFSLETRLFFLKSTSFGYSRLIDLWSNKSKAEGSDDSSNTSSLRAPMLGRSVRHKLRISRDKMFSSALKVMETYANNPGLIEIEFFEEIGSGLGPTLEFYSNVSKEFRRLRLFMWRSEKYFKITDENKDNDYYLFDKNGLFPRPLTPKSPHFKSVLLYFKVLGKFIARSFLDSRLVDFHFNPIFFELAMESIKKTKAKHNRNDSLKMLEKIDPTLASSIERLYTFLKELENKDNPENNDVQISDFMLTFVVPGYEDVLLCENGDETDVTNSNLSEYIDKLVDMTLYQGISQQIESFVSGFSEVFPFNSLVIFSPDELVRLLGNETENWSIETLITVIHADHGYNNKSSQIEWLIDIMSKFSKSDRRKFLKFMTGSPRLPFDGFKGLSPPFTVVLKHCEDGFKPDDYLPSVMTCANYLKLPCYSSREIMLLKITQAINGNDGFLLS